MSQQQRIVGQSVTGPAEWTGTRTGDVVAAGHDDVEHPHRDRVRWGPIWAGLATTLATFVLLQLAFVAMGVVDGEGNDAIWSAIAALVAFFVGGLVAGASNRWTRSDDDVLQGVVMWALSIVGLLVIGTIGASALAGAFGDAVGGLDALGDRAAGTNAQQLQDTAQSGAARALLSMGLALAAAVAGAVAGGRLWPRHRHTAGDRGYGSHVA